MLIEIDLRAYVHRVIVRALLIFVLYFVILKKKTYIDHLKRARPSVATQLACIIVFYM